MLVTGTILIGIGMCAGGIVATIIDSNKESEIEQRIRDARAEEAILLGREYNSIIKQKDNEIEQLKMVSTNSVEIEEI